MGVWCGFGIGDGGGGRAVVRGRRVRERVERRVVVRCILVLVLVVLDGPAWLRR